VGSILKADGGVLQYQAPDIPTTAEISVISPIAVGVVGKAKVTIIRPTMVTLGIVPASVSLYPLQSCQLSATVDGSFLKDVDWSAEQGTVDNITSTAAHWTAPRDTGTYYVTARSRADPNVSRSTTITVISPPVVIWLIPSIATLPTNSVLVITKGYSTNELPGANIATSWSSTGGNLTTSYDYQANFSASAPGIYTVEAKSTAYPSVVATCEVIVE
jgi:hypothetical protein